MKTKHYRSFFIIQDIVVDYDGYLCSDKVIIKYYGRHYAGRIGK